MFNPEKLIAANEELVIIGKHHSGRTLAAGIILGNFIKSRKDDIVNKAIILLIVEYSEEAGFWLFLRKELGLIEEIYPATCSVAKSQCLNYLASKGYQIEILQHMGKLENTDPFFDKLALYDEGIILIDNANRELSFDFDNTKVIRTDLYDDRYHDWSAISARYPKPRTIVQTSTDHAPNGKRSILFNFFRGEADSLTTTLKYEF